MASIREGGSTTRPPILGSTINAYWKDIVKTGVKIDRSLKCRECEGYGHYQVLCPNFMRRQKKSFSATLFDDDTDESDEEGECTKTFISILSKDEVKDSEEESEDNLSFEQLKIKWKEDSEARVM
ncbi:MADS-box transcription factor PHERES 2-like [Cucumis melo var. makuwa]|uniref:MADS-box transcription factor PHERES 2-like n=1 Tax=Cucumis melo var. makuwa TaxID=1194695 RepID=A0A5A7UH09_CUCMM|nr:MADS-box transcription factor PHERES 2-like [Cucumis melo var. makuwa]